MKSSRSAALILSILAIPLAAFAADGKAKVIAIKGAPVTVDAGKKTPVAAGQELSAGSTLEAGGDSSVSLELSGGNKVVLAPGTRVRISKFQISDDGAIYSIELMLIRGTITGDATNGAGSSTFKVRTPCGQASLAGSAYQIEFTPVGATGGTLSVTSMKGLPSLTPTGALTPVAVPNGNTVSLTSNGVRTGVPQVSQTPPSKVAQIETILGSSTATTGETTPLVTNPEVKTGGNSVRFDPTALVSPNGEGSVL